MLKIKTVQLAYTPVSWGIKMIGGRITASILWKNDGDNFDQFGADSAEYEEFCKTFMETKEFTELGRAYAWLNEKTQMEA